MIKIPFTLTAAQVDALETTAVTVFAFPTSAEIVYLPERLVVSRAAGTGYTVSADARFEVYDEDGTIWFSFPASGLLSGSSAAFRVAKSGAGALSSANTALSVRIAGGTISGTGVSVSGYVEATPVVGRL